MSLIKEISQVIGGGTQEAPAQASLVELDPNNDSFDVSSTFSFQYYPETISDTRSVDLKTKYGIGSSHPIYQWTHGSPREISFDVVFTSENKDLPFTVSYLNNQPTNDVNDLLNKISIASSIIQNPLSAINLLNLAPEDQHSVVVAAGINWLRAKTYPLYDKNAVYAPPKMLLHLPNSGIASFVNKKELDLISVIMTRCDVTYESFFRNGTPRVATVSLSFVETIQIGSSWSYVNRKDFNRSWQGFYNTKPTREPHDQQPRPNSGAGNASSILPKGANIPFSGK